MIFLGIDPGKSGGLATISINGHVEYVTMPITELDIWEWVRKRNKSKFCCIELVHSRPKQSSVATFTFGCGYGGLRMALVAAQIPFDTVLPRTWQKEFSIKSRLKSESRIKYKDRLRSRAQQLFPKLPIWEGTLTKQRAVCDAILIAEYARRKYG